MAATRKPNPVKRVRTYDKPILSMRVEVSLIRKIDAWAKKRDVSRSAAIRTLLQKAVK